MLKKNFEFDSSRRDNTVALNLSFILLPAEVDFIIEKQNCKKDAFKIGGIGYVKIIFVLPVEVIILNIWLFII